MIGVEFQERWPQWCPSNSDDKGDLPLPNSHATNEEITTRWRQKLTRMFRYKRLVSLIKRRPLVAVAVIGLIIFCVVYTFTEENYEQIGTDLLAEKEMILQDINNALEETKPLDERQIFEMDQSERRKRIRMVCETNEMKKPGMINSLIKTDFNLTYCIIPRTDNTFWLQVLRYINRDFLETQPQSPFDLDVEEVHSRHFTRTRIHVWRMLTEEQKQIITKSRIFMSVQDPYMRLWSTYIRSLILPELWDTVGVRISHMRSVLTKPKLTACGNDATFDEFIQYVMDSYEKDFAAYTHLCDPCKLDPYYVIKAETARRDNAFILENVKLAHTVKVEQYDEMTMMRMVNSTVRQSFKKLHEADKRGCEMTIKSLNLRLWKIFMMEGVIPEGSVPPPLDDVGQTQMVEIVINCHRTAINEGADMTQQKRKFMVAAYKNLNPSFLDDIVERYNMDFKLFSYDSHPLDIFGGV